MQNAENMIFDIHHMSIFFLVKKITVLGTFNKTKNGLLNQSRIKSSSGDIDKDQFQINN